jgi:hypothetical protein
MQSYEMSAAVNHLPLSFVLQQGVVPKPSWCALHLLPPITMTHYKRTQTKGNTKQKNPLRDNQSKLSSDPFEGLCTEQDFKRAWDQSKLCSDSIFSLTTQNVQFLVKATPSNWCGKNITTWVKKPPYFRA